MNLMQPLAVPTSLFGLSTSPHRHYLLQHRHCYTAVRQTLYIQVAAVGNTGKCTVDLRHRVPAPPERGQQQPHPQAQQQLSSNSSSSGGEDSSKQPSATIRASAAVPPMTLPVPAPVPVAGSPSAVAIDVEYSHVVLDDGSQASPAAWLAVVDQQCNLLLKTYINPEVEGVVRAVGGVSLSRWAAAPSLADVQQQLLALAAGKLLIGHGLAKDLAALGFNHPQHLRLDTMTHPGFCNKAGNSRSLKQLAKHFLGLNIQQQPRQQQQQQQRKQQSKLSRKTAKGRKQSRQAQPSAVLRVQHDPQEDAAAVMRLYTEVVLPSTYEGQVAAATQQLLLEIQRRQQQLQQQAEGDGCEAAGEAEGEDQQG